MAGGGGAGPGAGPRCPRRTRSAGEALPGGAVSSLPRRRSARNVAAAQSLSLEKPRLVASKTVASPRPQPFATRPITLKKIVPRSQQRKAAASTPRRSPRISLKEDKENIPVGVAEGKGQGSNAQRGPEPLCLRGSSDSPAGAGVLSPVSPQADGSRPGDERDLAMAKRVRRSYSRLELSLTRSFLEGQESPGPGLSDTSTPSHGPGKRQTLFGFDQLLAPGGLASVSPVNTSAPLKATASEAGAPLGPDTDIPGISFIKAIRRRKKKMPQFDKSELDEWAAQKNAEFEEAEKFDLLVE
ncbi:sororin [Hemicordylus capensis]|uniref:sororin n=1 Tax=Hemicordylus capensis TaxID=884348 RepID=UPI002303F976|nr:sororin [Hemicordylus capensis]